MDFNFYRLHHDNVLMSIRLNQFVYGEDIQKNPILKNQNKENIQTIKFIIFF